MRHCYDIESLSHRRGGGGWRGCAHLGADHAAVQAQHGGEQRVDLQLLQLRAGGPNVAVADGSKLLASVSVFMRYF